MKTWDIVASVDGSVEAETQEEAEEKFRGLIDGDLNVRIELSWTVEE